MAPELLRAAAPCQQRAAAKATTATHLGAAIEKHYNICSQANPGEVKYLLSEARSLS